jgi:hypothetical protein
MRNTVRRDSNTAVVPVTGMEVVQGSDTIQVRGALQIVIPTRTESEYNLYHKMNHLTEILSEHSEQMKEQLIHNIEMIDSLSVLYDVQSLLDKKIEEKSVAIDFMKTKDMAQNLRVSESFLEKNMGILFYEGTHYFKNGDARLLRWDVRKMHEWMKGERNDDALINKLLG